jgi:hypothetical protein
MAARSTGSKTYPTAICVGSRKIRSASYLSLKLSCRYFISGDNR